MTLVDFDICYVLAEEKWTSLWFSVRRGILKSGIVAVESFTCWKNEAYEVLILSHNLKLVKKIYTQSLNVVTHCHLEWLEAMDWNQTLT